MKFEKACYSRKALYECVDKVKALPRAARVRADHSALCMCVTQTFDFCLEKSCCLFERFSPWKITQGVKNKFTKRKWTSCMQAASVFEKQLIEIHKMMETGEVDSID
ncbi:MAG: hypothetical protein ACLSB9_22305 [Hydrogeniiclostridium mannosilyticum]